MKEETMQKQAVVFVVLILMMALSATVFAKANFDNIAGEVKEGVVTINGIMVNKDRVKALAALDEVLEMVDKKGGDAQAELHKSLGRLKYYLSKYNWDRARRILKGIMEDLDLEYQPTYP